MNNAMISHFRTLAKEMGINTNKAGWLARVAAALPKTKR